MKAKLFILISCLIIGILVFVNATNNDYEKETSGVHQIKDIVLKSNSKKDSQLTLPLAHSTKDKIKYEVKVLSKDDLVYKGEKKIKDSSLGDNIIELTLYDTRAQKKIKDLYGLKTNKLNKTNEQQLLDSIRIAYPPDDSMLVLYISCSDKSTPTIDDSDGNLTLNLASNT